jgi:hypothetical protein
VIVTTAPMGYGVRVAGPRVPASTLTFRTAGGGVRESSLRTSSARFPGNTSTTGSNRRWRPVCSRRTVSQQPGNSGPSTPVRPAATRYAPQHPLKRTGALLGSQSGAKGDGRARTKDIPARIRGAGGHPACREYAKKGQWSQVTCASVVVAHCWSWLVLPKPEGTHQEYQRLASGLEPPEQAARCTRPGGPGHSDQMALGRHVLFGLDGTARRVTWDVASPVGKCRQVHPAEGDR